MVAVHISQKKYINFFVDIKKVKGEKLIMRTQIANKNLDLDSLQEQVDQRKLAAETTCFSIDSLED